MVGPERRVMHKHYRWDGAFAPPHYSKVSGYTRSTIMATKICMILMTCAAVIFTDSVNSNMGFLHERASAERPAPAIRRTLVGGYEGTNLGCQMNAFFPAVLRGSDPLRDTHAAHWPVNAFCPRQR